MDESLKLCHNLAWRSLKTFKRINGFEDFRKWKVWRIFAGSTHCGGESYLIQLPDIFSPLSTHPSHCPQDLAGYFFRKSSKEYYQKKRFRIFQTETLEPLPVPSNPLPGFPRIHSEQNIETNFVCNDSFHKTPKILFLL